MHDETHIERIVSGGQTGVDRGALDAAISHGVRVGGWCPRGRWAEDGRIDDRYPLDETPEADQGQRTIWNVRDSDGTLIVAGSAGSPGTLLTEQEARRLHRPVLVVRGPSDAARIRRWLATHDIRVLNVAGPRESEKPGSYSLAHAVVEAFLSASNSGG